MKLNLLETAGDVVSSLSFYIDSIIDYLFTRFPKNVYDIRCHATRHGNVLRSSMGLAALLRRRSPQSLAHVRSG